MRKPKAPAHERAAPPTQRTQRPVGSYLLRVVEERTVQVALVYELHDIATGTRLRFASLAALQRHLAGQGREQRRNG